MILYIYIYISTTFKTHLWGYQKETLFFKITLLFQQSFWWRENTDKLRVEIWKKHMCFKHIAYFIGVGISSRK